MEEKHMIIDSDDNIVYFQSNNKIFRTSNKDKVENNLKEKIIKYNDVNVYYAAITSIEYADDEINCELITRDGSEITYTINKEIEDEELPSYLNVYNENTPAQIAIKTIILEVYRKITNDNTSLPEASTINELQAEIKTLTGQVETLTTEKGTLEGQVETLTSQLEAAQSQAGSGSNVNTSQLSQTQIFTVGSTDYAIKIVAIGETGYVSFILETANQTTIKSVSTLGFTSQRGQATYANTTDNTNITLELYLDGTVQSAGLTGAVSDAIAVISKGSAVADGTVVCVKVTIKDSNDEVLSSAYDTMTYVAPASNE